MTRIFTILFLSTLLSACSFDHMKDEGAQKVGGGAITQRAVSYNEAFASVISPRCVSCHSQGGGNQGGINLETFESTSALAIKIQKSVFVDRTMPKGQALSDMESSILAAWIEQGASRNGGGRRNPKLKEGITWTVVRDEIFANKCLECHSQPRPEANLDLTSFSETKEKIGKIFDRAVITQDMPLPPLEILTVDEKQALATWIALGMPE